jgi:CRISPR/Cas system-associated exonuclease Cas4 (RecB family)
MRGYWIEPQKLKYLRSSAEESFTKRIPIHTAKRDLVTEQFHEVLEHLKAVHLSLGNISHEERFIMEHQVSNIRFLIQAIEKKVAERKKIA